MEIIEKISYLYARMAVEDIDLVDYWVTDICASTNQVLAKKLDESSGENVDSNQLTKFYYS